VKVKNSIHLGGPLRLNQVWFICRRQDWKVSPPNLFLCRIPSHTHDQWNRTQRYQEQNSVTALYVPQPNVSDRSTSCVFRKKGWIGECKQLGGKKNPLQ